MSNSYNPTFEKRIAKGLCPGCGEKNDRPNRYYCSKCGQYIIKLKRIRKERLREEHKCIVCGHENKSIYATCESCREKERLNKLKYRGLIL